MPKTFHVAAVAVAIVALVLVIVGVAIPYWLNQETKIISSNMGLWQWCHKTKEKPPFSIVADGCNSIVTTGTDDFITPTKGLELFGLIVLAIAIILAVVHMLVMKEQDLLYFGEAGASVFAGFFMLIGAIVFAVKKNDSLLFKEYDLHAGFALCIVAAVLAIVAGVIFFIAKNKQ